MTTTSSPPSIRRPGRRLARKQPDRTAARTGGYATAPQGRGRLRALRPWLRTHFAGESAGHDWRRATLLVPLAMFAVLTTDLLTPEAFRPQALVGLLPLAAALIFPALVTAGTTVLVLAAYPLMHHFLPTDGGTGWAWTPLLVVFSGGLLGVALARLREIQQARLTDITDVAEATQRAVMRPMPDRIRDLHIADLYRPAVRSARVGGDWYDFQPTPHGVRAVLGDVSGKGLPAVSASAALLGDFRSSAYHEADIEEVARRLEIAMQRYHVWARHTGADDASQDVFSTALLLHFHENAPDEALVEAPGAAFDGSRDGGTSRSGDSIDIINFGHEPPLLVEAGGRIRAIETEPALPLGMGTLYDKPPTAVRVPFLPGDTLVMFTDGVSESRGADGTFYPVRDRLPLLPTDGSPQDLVDALAKDLGAHHPGAPSDDAAIVVIRRTPEALRPTHPNDLELYYRKPGPRPE